MREVYIFEDLGYCRNLRKAGEGELSAEVLEALKTRCENLVVHIDSRYFYTGYGPGDDVTEIKQLTYRLPELLEGPGAVTGFRFVTTAAVEEDGSLAGVVIDSDECLYLLTFVHPVNLYDRSSYYDHRESVFYADFTLTEQSEENTKEK